MHGKYTDNAIKSPHLLLKFSYHIVYDIEVTHEIKSCIGIVQPLAGFGGIENVQGAFGADAEMFAQKDDDASYLVPKEEVAYHPAPPFGIRLNVMHCLKCRHLSIRC